MMKSTKISVSDETVIFEGKFSKREMKGWKPVLGGRCIEPTTVCLLMNNFAQRRLCMDSFF